MAYRLVLVLSSLLAVTSAHGAQCWTFHYYDCYSGNITVTPEELSDLGVPSLIEKRTCEPTEMSDQLSRDATRVFANQQEDSSALSMTDDVVVVETIVLPNRLQSFKSTIQSASEKDGLSPLLTAAVILAESDGDPKAVSNKGAIGLMQLMPDTATELGVRDPYDPNQNIIGGVRYLRQQMDKYGDTTLALAAYNAGPGRVDHYGGVPPYRMTKEYIRAVKSNFETLRSMQP